MAIVLQAKVGKHKEISAALQRLRGKNADVSGEAAEIIVKILALLLGLIVSHTKTYELKRLSCFVAGLYRNLSAELGEIS